MDKYDNSKSLREIFGDACLSADSVRLVRIPSDYSEPQKTDHDPGPYGKIASIGKLNSDASQKISAYFNGMGQQKPDYLYFGSGGGAVNAARDLATLMDGRQEVVYMAQAESAATVLIAHADNVYAPESASMMFHEARLSQDFIKTAWGQSIYDDFKNITGKDDKFLIADVMKLRDVVTNQLGHGLYAQVLNNAIDVMRRDNEYLANSYHATTPGLSQTCAALMVTPEDKFISATQAVKLGMVDAVLYPDATGPMMLVRENDPRAVAFQSSDPEWYAALNMSENQPADQTQQSVAVSPPQSSVKP